MIELTNKYGEPLTEKEIAKQIEEQKRERKMLVVRNWLNSIFILLSIVAIIGVLVFKGGEPGLYYSYGIAVVAVIIKMVEAMFRMPGIGKKL